MDTVNPPCLNGDLLNEAKCRLAEGDVSLQPALAQLRDEATSALQAGPFTVMQKTLTSASGDKHDYHSLGPYWWPDPETPDGLPWVRRDGEVNPAAEDDSSDRSRLLALADTVETLGLAWHFTANVDSATRAAVLLRTWFLDPDTRMNPDLEYGQAIPGICDGRFIGIIDTSRLTKVVDAAVLIEDAESWTDSDADGLRAWCRDYLRWLLEGEFGRKEAAHPNNHGTWFDVQSAALALYVGEIDTARSLIAAAAERRIAAHVKPDGSQPQELARTRSLDYSLFNLWAMMMLAEMGEKVGIDLWHFQTPDGRCIKRAVDYLTAYADPSCPWPHEQIIEPPLRTDLMPQILLRAARAWDDPRYIDACAHMPLDVIASHRANLLYPRRPPGRPGEESMRS